MDVTRLADRLRALDPRRLDLLVALAIGLEMQVEVLFLPADAHVLLAHGCVLLLAAAVFLRRSSPLAALVLAQVSYVLIQQSNRATADNLFSALFIVLFITFCAARYSEDRWFRIAPPIAWAGGMLGMALDDYASSTADDVVFTTLIFVGAPMVVGRLLRNRAHLQRALRARAAREERERATASAAAVADERTRIAGELHDIVAHALSEMTVQATAARRLAHADPAHAAEAFSAIEHSGRDALAELRRLLGVLRRDDEELALAPQPSLRHVRTLAARARAAGLPVDLTVDGEPHDLPPGIDVTAYRVVQEALARALDGRHAGHAAVHVRYGDRAVELEVADDGAPGDDGSALLGLRERVAMYGGDLETAIAGPARHVLRARLPVEVPA